MPAAGQKKDFASEGLLGPERSGIFLLRGSGHSHFPGAMNGHVCPPLPAHPLTLIGLRPGYVVYHCTPQAPILKNYARTGLKGFINKELRRKS